MYRILISLLFLFSNLQCQHHVIYITGPCDKPSWYKSSKLIYKGLRKEVESQGNTIELFPKRKYRESIYRHKHLKSNSISRSRLILAYEDEDLLVEELVKLIIKRRDEILRINDEDLDTRIHLRSHCMGSNIIKKLLRTDLSSYLGTLVSIDGQDTTFDEDFLELESISSINTRDILENIRGSETNNTIINVTINELKSESEIWELTSGYRGCTTKKFLGTVGLIVGIVGGILALL